MVILLGGSERNFCAARLVRHCRQCRADAVGLLGEDRSDEFSKSSFSEKSFEELEEDGVGAEIFDTSVDSSDSVMITIEGLVSLGYSKSEAAIAVNKVEDAKDLTPEELLKKALKNIMI